MRRKTAFAMAAVFLLGTLVSAAEFSFDIKEYRLDNGLTILLYENHDIPLISYYTFFKVGSRNERPGITGISHFFEHMMFNGAKKYGPKMFDGTLERKGGYSNAYTSNDLTVYWEECASDNLEMIIDLESDRMANLAFDPEMLASEIGVVKEERLVGVENNNVSLLNEELQAAAFKAHSYGWPILGWMADLGSITRDDCVNYFRTYYAPNNAVVVIAGDFDSNQALALMKKYFDGIPAGPPPPPVVANEPEQIGPRRVIIERQAPNPYLMTAYHVGDKDSPDLPALEIVQFILTTGESSRMYQGLINDLELVTEVYGGFSWGFNPSLFEFSFAVNPDIDPSVVERAADSILTNFIATGSTEEEITRAKNGLKAYFYKKYKTNGGIAHEIGYYHTCYGDWKKMYDFITRINAVTPQQVQEAAAKYFRNSNCTTAILIPEGGQR